MLRTSACIRIFCTWNPSNGLPIIGHPNQCRLEVSWKHSVWTDDHTCPWFRWLYWSHWSSLRAFTTSWRGSSSKETPCPAYWHAVSTREAILAEAPCACLLNSVMYAAIGFWTTIPSHSPCPYHKKDTPEYNFACLMFFDSDVRSSIFSTEGSREDLF